MTHGKDKPLSTHPLPTDLLSADHRRRPGRGRIAQVAVTVSAMVAATVVAPVAATVVTAAPATAAGTDVHLIVVDADAFGGQGGLIGFNAANGAAATLWQSPYGGNSYGVAVDRDGTLLVVDRDAFPGGPGGVIRVNQVTGTATPITSDRYLSNPTGIVVAPDGAIFVVDADARASLTGDSGVGGVIKVNPTTGEQTLVSSGGVFGNPTGIAVEPCSGVGCPNGYDLLVADMSSFGGDGGVIRVNPANGAQTELASNGDFGDPTGLVVAPSGDVYVVDQNWDSGDGGVIKLPAGSIQPGDPVVHPTVSGNEVSGHDEWGNPTGITLGSDGMLYVADPDKAGANGDDGAIFRVDPATKAVTQLARTGGAPGLFQGPVGLAVAPATPPAAPPVPQGPYAPKTFTQPAAGAANCTLSTYTVPPGVTQLGFTVTAEAGKAGEGIIGGHLGGVGGFADTATGVLAVTPGEVLYANVARNGSGGQGRDYGGFGGDLAFLSTDSQSGIPIDLGGCAAASFLVVAGGGGGGGAADSTYGGNGGGAGTPVASNGRSGDSGNLPTYEPGRGGGGASLAAGGAAAPGGSNSLAGAAQRGGSGAQGDWHGDGGGGGGGYYGGGGGGGGSGTADLYAGGGGGGGGSTYFGPTVSDGAAYWAPTRATTPSVTLTPLGVTSSLSLAANPASATVGASVVLTATISPAPSSSPLPADPGTVTFTVDGTTIGTAAVDAATGVATLSTAFSSTGTKQITATYTGNGFLSSSTGSTTITVTNNPPAWISPTPAEGAVIDATPGSPVTIVVKAGDPDAGDIVTLTVPSGAPTGSSWSTSGSNPATGTLTVTPSAAGQLTIGFGAYDGSSLHAADRHVTLAVTQKSPTISWDTPAAITYGTALGADQLDAALSTAQGALTPPHAGTFTYTPAAGTVPHAGDNTLSVTWNPDTADAAAWSAVTAMVTLHVNQAPQTLLFSPAISDSTTYSYGDPPFTVTAVSDAGLPVTYSVGTGDACTSTPSGGSTTITITGVGPCTLSVDQTGDADHTAAATLTHSFTIAKKTPTLTLTPADTVYGTPLGSGQLDATINPADAAGHGDIGYTVDGGAIPTDGILPAGSHTLTATFTPDAESNYNTASAGATFTVAKADQSVTFGALADKTFGDASFTVAATSSAGLTITFTTPTTDVCAVTTAGTVSLLHAGTCTVSAEQAGDDNHNAATSVTQSFTVGKAAQAITFTSPNNATYLDAALTLSAIGGASGNLVTFTAGPVDVCTVTGGTLTLTGAGDCTITAHEDGNADYLAAAPVGHTITIAKATPTVSWSTPGQISYGTPLGAAQLDATVTPAIAGTFGYTLADGTTDAAGAVLHASATPQTLHVTFTPTDAADYDTATGQTQITVVKADQAITWSSVPTDKTYGDAPFDVSAVGGGSGNPVTFTVQSGSTCTVSGTTVTITGAGACVLAADQAGNDDYNPATTSTQSLTVARQTPTITWATPPDIVYGTALSAAQLNATVTPSGAADNGTLAYTTDAASGAAAGQVLHAGTHSLTATYTPGSSGAGPDYTGATATVALTVTQATQAITGFTLSDGTLGDGPITLSATGGDSDNPVTFTVQTGSTCEIGGDGVTLTFTGAGSCTVTAHQAGNADYLDAPGVTQTITLAKAPQEIAFAQPADSHVADPTITLTATGGGSGNSVTFTGGPLATCSSTATGILTITGPGTCTVTASQLGNGNYLDATPVARSFTVSYRICDLTPTNQWGVLLGVLQIQVTTCDAAGHSLASRSIVVHATGVDGGPAIPVGFFQRGNNFRYIGWHGGSYVYNLWVGDLADGTHTMTFTVAGDPTEHSIDFTLNGGCLSIWRLLF